MRMRGLFALVLLAGGCAGDPGPVDPEGRTLGTQVDPGARAFRVAVSAPAQGDGIVLDGVDLTFDASRGEVSFRAALVNGTDRPLFAPLDLVITDVRPPDVRALNPDRRTEDGAPVYSFTAEAGEDGVLGPGESTLRRTVAFADPARVAFALGAILHTGVGPALGAIGGAVFFDRDPDSHRGPGEPGIPGIPVSLAAASRVVAETRTDLEGRYVFTGLAPGFYAVRKGAPDLLTRTPNPLHVVLVPGENGQAQSFLAADFACFRRGEPGPEPHVLLGPLRVLASGETVTGVFELDQRPGQPLLLVVEVIGRGEHPLAEAEVAVNGHAVVTEADFPGDTRRIRREILPDLLRAGENTVEIRADGGGGGEVFLVVTVLGG